MQHLNKFVGDTIEFESRFATRLRLALLTVLIAVPALAWSQTGTALKGVVLDSKTKAPVPFCSVFLARTMIGSVASAEGAYELTQIPPGKYDLTVSCLGYKTLTVPWAPGSEVEIRTIEIDPEARVLSQITVTDHSAKKKYIDLFKQTFLGDTRNAKECTILNLDDIFIEYDKDSMKVTAFYPSPIIVENRALGYKLLYSLADFRMYIKPTSFYVVTEGVPRFELLTPKSKKEETQWAAAREKAYRGSLVHFMRSLKNKRLTAELFSVALLQKNGQPVAGVIPDEAYLLSTRPDSLSSMLIQYTGEKPESSYPLRGMKEEISLLRFGNTGLKVYGNGYYDLPKNFFIDGYMGWGGGIAELVPLEYEPVGEKP
jgi:hypothetical protein